MKERGLDIQRGLRAMEDEPVFKEYRPEFLSEGGDQLIFTVPDHPKSVVKVRKEWMRQILLSPDVRDVSFSDAPEEYRVIIHDALQAERERFLQLSQYFPRMVLRERFVVMRIPLDNRIVQQIFQNITLDQKAFFDVPVRIQERKDLRSGEYVSLTHRYIGHKEPVPLDVFLQSLQPVIFSEKPARHYFRMDVLLRQLSREIPREENLQSIMKDFVESAARYTAETDQILDVAGINNIVLDKDAEGAPRIALIDPLAPPGGVTFSIFKSIVRYAANRDLNARERNYVKNGLHYARFMASLAYEFAPQCAPLFSVPDLEGPRASINVYRVLCHESA